MHLPKPHFRPMPLFYKILATLFIVGFLIIGVIGLILPVIPGIIFLLLAAYLVTHVSRRAATAAHNHPWFSRHMKEFDRAGKLSIGQRTRLSFLVVAKLLIQSVESAVSFAKGLGKGLGG